MARRLSADVNELILQDRLSNSEIVFYYRLPTTAERLAYAGQRSQRIGNKVKDKSFETRLKGAKKILTGIREGDFEIPDGKGKFVPLASDPASPHYRQDWKEKVEEYGSDLLELLAYHVFEFSVVDQRPGQEETAEAKEPDALEEDIDPDQD